MNGVIFFDLIKKRCNHLFSTSAQKTFASCLSTGYLCSKKKIPKHKMKKNYAHQSGGYPAVFARMRSALTPFLNSLITSLRHAVD